MTNQDHQSDNTVWAGFLVRPDPQCRIRFCWGGGVLLRAKSRNNLATRIPGGPKRQEEREIDPAWGLNVLLGISKRD